MEVLSFRVEQYDSDGNHLDSIPVELGGSGLWGSTIRGQLSDGDEVDVSGRWQAGTVRAQLVTNVSTGAQIEDRSSWENFSEAFGDGSKARKPFLVGLSVFIAIGVAVVALIGTGIFLFIRNADRDFQNHQQQMSDTWESHQSGYDESYQDFCQKIRNNGMTPPADCQEVPDGG